MPGGPVIKSALEEALKKLPASLKPQSLKNTLKKKGVKDEEIKFSRVEERGIKDRADTFLTVDGGKEYEAITLYREDDMDYAEKVLTFSDKGARPDVSRFTSEHYPGIPDYLLHTRVTTDTVNGVDSHVVLEIQSDLHQMGRQQGYTQPIMDDELKELAKQ